MITLARRVAAVRGSAIRDLLTLTARPEVISLAGGLPAPDLLPPARVAAAHARRPPPPGADRRGRGPRPHRTGRRPVRRDRGYRPAPRDRRRARVGPLRPPD